MVLWPTFVSAAALGGWGGQPVMGRLVEVGKGSIWSCKLAKRCYIDPLKLFIGIVISLEKVLAGHAFVECQ